MPSVRRIAVLGCGGAGKTTLARALGERLGLPVIHLDAHYWRPGWTPTPDAEWEALQIRLLSGGSWVADGSFHTTLPVRLARAQAVVLLDLPTRVCLVSAIARWTRHRGEQRPDIGPGCPERFDLSFLLWIAGWRRRSRPRMIPMLRDFEARGGVLIRLRSRREAARWLASVGLGDLGRGGQPRC